MDATATVYLTIIVSQATIFCMCGWWITVAKEPPSVIFKCFMALSGGLCLNFIPVFLARIGVMALDNGYRETVWWTCRPLPIAIISVIILLIFIGRLTERNYGDRP